MRRPVLLFLAFSACVGPPAPDAELCRDVIARLCAQPHCVSASTRLALPTMGCEVELETRTGCGNTDFAFTMPTRERVLDCRLPLVRDGAERSAHPSCEYVDETIRNCSDLVVFLGGTP